MAGGSFSASVLGRRRHATTTTPHDDDDATRRRRLGSDARDVNRTPIHLCRRDAHRTPGEEERRGHFESVVKSG